MASLDKLEAVFRGLEETGRREVADQGAERIHLKRKLDLRYKDTDVPLTVICPEDSDYSREFARQHRRLYGYEHSGREIEVVPHREGR